MLALKGRLLNCEERLATHTDHFALRSERKREGVGVGGGIYSYYTTKMSGDNKKMSCLTDNFHSSIFHSDISAPSPLFQKEMRDRNIIPAFEPWSSHIIRLPALFKCERNVSCGMVRMNMHTLTHTINMDTHSTWLYQAVFFCAVEAQSCYNTKGSTKMRDE